MKLGLLQCDHVSDPMRAEFGDVSDLFLRLFAKFAPEVSLDIFDVTEGRFPDQPEAYDGFIGTGSRFSVYDDIPWIIAFKEYVSRLYRERISFVGICFGHQMIAEALGGKCERAQNGWGLGIKPVTVFSEKPWMDPPLGRYRLLLSHLDQVVRLPENSEVLGGNDHCPRAMFTVGDHFLGIQAHPEFTPEYDNALMTSRLDRIGIETVEAARKTLLDPTDEATITRWIVNFIENF